MPSNGVRKRVKVRWMKRPDEYEDSHAFPILTGGTLRDYAMCGLPLGSMHHWSKDEKHRDACRPCKQATGKGARA
jgi:hypothetical protein